VGESGKADEATGGMTENPYRQSATFYNVNTSYWMPERPDLQGAIAHEIAHTLLSSRLNELSFQALDSRKEEDELTRFFKHSYQAIQIFHHFDETPAAAKAFWLELAADLLATSIVGPAYLYALFLEILGSGVENLFISATHRNRFDLETLEMAAIDDQYLSGDWHCRLVVVATWLEKVFPAAEDIPSRDFGINLAASVKSLSGTLMAHLLDRALPPRKNLVFWESLTERLCRLVESSEILTEEVKDWTSRTVKDHYHPDKEGRITLGQHIFPRCSRRLHWEVRNLLVSWLTVKINARLDRAGAASSKQRDSHYAIYGISNFPPSEQQQERWRLHCLPLFSRLYGIPWQCAILRALEFVHPQSKVKPEIAGSSREDKLSKWFHALHHDMQMGRDLYLIALEFFLDEYAPSTHRLMDCAGWVELFISRDERTPNASLRLTIKALKRWLAPRCALQNPSDDLNRVCEFYKQVKRLDKECPKPKTHDDSVISFVNRWKEFVDSWSVKELLRLEYLHDFSERRLKERLKEE
jgi:hypothetical protein